MIKGIAFFSCVFCFLFGCSNSKKSIENVPSKTKEINKIHFYFQDASVPPDDHRSLTFKITPSKLIFLVDSYGDVVKDTNIKLSAEKWNQIVSSIEHCELSKSKSSKELKYGCSGGTGNSIEVFFDDGSSWNAHIYYCGNEYEGDLLGDIPCFLESIKKDIDPTVFAHD